MKPFKESVEANLASVEQNLKMEKKMSRRGVAIAAAALTVIGLAACAGGNESRQIQPTITAEPEGTEKIEEYVEIDNDLRDPDILHRAEQIISTFENSTTEIRYDYVETLEDGRGITAGRAGFTSETQDLLYVVKTYMEMGGKGQLAELLDELEEANRTDLVEKIVGFEEAWQEAIEKDSRLINAQDKVYHEWYFEPALKWADEIGIKTALGQTILLDTIIQHGEGNDVDSFPSIVQETTEEFGAVESQEKEWLRAFLNIRKQHLANAADPDTRDVWAASVDRVEALRSFLDSDPPNLSLAPPLQWEVYGDYYSITE